MLSCGIWVLVDQPSFFEILDDAYNVCNEGDTTCDDNRAFYPFTFYIMVVIIVIVMPIAFFGCCGEMKESICLLRTYLMTKYAKIVQKHQLIHTLVHTFMKESICLLVIYMVTTFAKIVQNQRTLVHIFVVMMLICAIFHHRYSDSVNFEDTVKTPFEKALKRYNDQPAEDDQSAQNYKSVWNEVQAEVRRNRDCEFYSYNSIVTIVLTCS